MINLLYFPDRSDSMSSNASKILTMFALIVAIGSGFMYFKTLNDVGGLESRIDSLNTQISNYISQVSSLQHDVEMKDSKIDNLQHDYGVLENQYSVLESMYNSLSADYENLSVSYDELDYLYTLNTELSIGNSLTSYYDYLRMEFGPTGSRSQWQYEEESCKFASCLALHDLHRLYWNQAEEYYGRDVGQQSYAQAWEVLKKAVQYCGIDSDDSDTEKVEKVLAFVSGFVVYESEIDNSLRAPVETLSLRSGDCDDFSILVAALLEAVDIDTGIGFFESDGAGHAMVLVHMDELDGYRCWYYSDLTKYDFEPGNWLEIEPQRIIDYQSEDAWFSQWSLYMAVEVDYDKAT
jgi:hypothetical protein